MGHFDQGISLALPSQVLRYGFLTINGRTGGVKLEASLIVECNSVAANAMREHRMAPGSPGTAVVAVPSQEEILGRGGRGKGRDRMVSN
jgi:hypothetical protein